MENNSYAVIKTGGKQYRVSPGDRIRVEKLPQNAGEEVVFGNVILLKDGDTLHTGKPTIPGAAVVAEVGRQLRDRKVLVFKKRSKKGYKKLQGHRQNLTEVLIKSFKTGS